MNPTQRGGMATNPNQERWFFIGRSACLIMSVSTRSAVPSGPFQVRPELAWRATPVRRNRRFESSPAVAVEVTRPPFRVRSGPAGKVLVRRTTVSAAAPELNLPPRRRKLMPSFERGAPPRLAHALMREANPARATIGIACRAPANLCTEPRYRQSKPKGRARSGALRN